MLSLMNKPDNKIAYWTILTNTIPLNESEALETPPLSSTDKYPNTSWISALLEKTRFLSWWWGWAPVWVVIYCGRLSFYLNSYHADSCEWISISQWHLVFSHQLHRLPSFQTPQRNVCVWRVCVLGVSCRVQLIWRGMSQTGNPSVPASFWVPLVLCKSPLGGCGSHSGP